MQHNVIRRDIVAVGASAGGIQAISALLGALPSNLPACVLVVLHRPVSNVSYLAEVLARASRMRVLVAADDEELKHGTCLISPPDRHLTVGPGPRVRLLADHFYSAHTVDALFNSLAVVAGPRTIGVVLTGMLKDGALGLRAIKQAGGLALVQDPAEAEFPDMPLNALFKDGSVDLVGKIADLAAFTCTHTGLPALVSEKQG